MNQKGGILEVFVLMILFLLLFGLYTSQFQSIALEQTASSTWSGTGTFANLILQGIGLIFLMLTGFWLIKQHSREGISFQ